MITTRQYLNRPAMAVGNPMWTRVITDNYQILSSPSTMLFFEQGAPLVDGSRITIVFNGNEYTFEFKTSPDPNNPYQVQLNPTDYSVMANHIAGIRPIAEHYYVTTSGNSFTLTAKEINSKWDVTVVYSDIANTGNNAVYTAPKTSFKGYMEIFKQDDYTASRDESQLIGLLDADPHREELPQFSFAPLAADEDVLDWEIQEAMIPYFDIQLPNLDALPKVHGVMYHFWYKYFESYGSPPVAGLMQIEGGANNYYGVLKANVPHHRWDGQDFIDTYFDVNKKWLTNAPACKTVGINSNEWLSAYYDDALPHFLKITVYFNDGSTSTFNTTDTLNGSVQPNNVASFGSGPVQIQLKDEYPNNYSEICKYDVELWNTNGGNLTQKFTYCIDHKCYLNEVELVFLGQLGNWETARFTGELVQSYNNESVDAVRSRTPWNGDMHRYNKAKPKRDQVYKFSSGYKRDAEAEWLNELAISECVYLLIDGVFTPIYIDNNSGADFGNAAADVFSGGFTGKIANVV